MDLHDGVMCLGRGDLVHILCLCCKEFVLEMLVEEGEFGRRECT